MTDGLDVFVAERPQLRGLAYRMTGSLADADDVLQDAWVRWQQLDPSGRAAIERPGAWFSTTVTRLALDRLKSSSRTREVYVGPWLPEPVPTTGPDGAPDAEALRAESLTMGFLATLERLAPVERAVFLLADVFGESFPEIATTVDRSEAACRQIAHRARERVRDEHRRPVGAPASDAASTDALVGAFLGACIDGDVDAFRSLLRDDVVLVSDGGAAVHAARRPVVGFDRVVRFVCTITARLPEDATVEIREVNRQPAIVTSRDGAPWATLVLAPDGDRIAGIYVVVNPDKLAAVTADVDAALA